MRSMVEGSGAPLAAMRGDCVGNLDRRLQHLRSGDSDYRDALSCQELRAHVVACRPITHIVGDSVDLDSQLRSRTVEIDDVVADGVLLAELWAAGFAPDLAPQQHFRKRHLTPQSAGGSVVVLVAA